MTGAPADLEIAILVRWLPCPRTRLEKEVRAAARAAARVLGRRLPALSIALVGDRRIRRLHAAYKSRDSTTDVLAFPLEEEDRGSPGASGEIVVCVPFARRQARRRGLEPLVELLLYVAHGVLHLLGEQDSTPQTAGRMRILEQKALRRIGYQLPDSHLSEVET